MQGKVNKLRKETLQAKRSSQSITSIRSHKPTMSRDMLKVRKPTTTSDLLKARKPTTASEFLGLVDSSEGTITEEELESIRQRVAYLEKQNAETLEELTAATTLVMNLPKNFASDYSVPVGKNKTE